MRDPSPGELPSPTERLLKLFRNRARGQEQLIANALRRLLEKGQRLGMDESVLVKHLASVYFAQTFPAPRHPLAYDRREQPLTRAQLNTMAKRAAQLTRISHRTGFLREGGECK
jgi:hypothetical protein